MKAEFIRFEILKNLNRQPTHGYELFTMLYGMQVVKNRAQVYKFIKTMKKEGLLRADPPSKGDIAAPQKEILRVTEKGREIYLEELLGLLIRHRDILVERTLRKVSQQTFEQLGNLPISTDLRNKVIFIEYGDYWPLSRYELHFIFAFFEHHAEGAHIYIRRASKDPVFLPPWNKSIEIIEIPFEKGLPANFADAIIALGFDQKSLLHEKLDGPTSWTRSLKPDGVLILAYALELQRFEKENYYALLAEEFDPPYKERFYRAIGMKMPMLMKQDNALKNSEIEATLMKFCGKVRQYSIMGQYDAFLGMNIKGK
jgi:DNA-binding PadR family transcriptional regulator